MMDNINDIISSLTSEDIDMLKGVAQSILGNEQDTDSSPVPQNRTITPQPPIQANPLAGLGLNGDDLNMILRAKGIFDRMNSASSKNADLINALKPHLSAQSQQKADQAIKILKLFEVLPYIKELF